MRRCLIINRYAADVANARIIAAEMREVGLDMSDASFSPPRAIIAIGGLESGRINGRYSFNAPGAWAMNDMPRNASDMGFITSRASAASTPFHPDDDIASPFQAAQKIIAIPY